MTIVRGYTQLNLIGSAFSDSPNFFLQEFRPDRLMLGGGSLTHVFDGQFRRDGDGYLQGTFASITVSDSNGLVRQLRDLHQDFQTFFQLGRVLN